MAPPPSLLGPPELSADPSLLEQQTTAAAVQDPFMDLMVANFNKNSAKPPEPEMGRTENDSATYLSTGNPCLDFFFHVVPDSSSDSIRDLLFGAWHHNPLTTLKLICNLRGVRGTGKSDKEGFYRAAMWLHKFQPKTLACNVPYIADFGYFKDFPEILYRLLEGAEVRDAQREEWKEKKTGAGSSMRRDRCRRCRVPFSVRNPKRHPFRRQKQEKKAKNSKPALPIEVRARVEKQRAEMEKQQASIARKEKKLASAKKFLLRYTRDADYKFLYDRITDFFAECLKADLLLLNSDDVKKISLAAKWCPSVDSSFDRSILLCESIARKIFPRESYPEYEGIEEAHYAYRVRDRLRKEVLVPLRKVLDLPEVYIGANKWDSLPYNRVASVAMKFYKGKFLKHDNERFNKYLKDVGAGKVKIASGALLPHDIVKEARMYAGGDQVAELQWKRRGKKMTDDDLLQQQQQRKLKNCIAVCDVSRSLSDEQMEACLALGLLVSEMSEEPWKGKVITFSDRPQLQVVKGDIVMEKVMFVEQMAWGGKKNLQEVFDLILQVAVAGKLKEEQMIKRVFVFSDMEFSKASSTPTETDYQAIVRKFTEKGYGKVIPEIVFWNVRDSKATPVPGTQEGVALVSGFSKNLMKLFLNGGVVLTPEAVMESAISGDEYQKLAVLE